MHDDSEIFTTVCNSALFSGLNKSAIKNLIAKCHRIELQKNENLFLQGDKSDGLYILLSGKLIIILKEKQLEKIIGVVDPGETVGELGAITEAPRTATVQATDDSVVLKVFSKDFVELANQFPEVMSQLLNKLAKRSRSLIEMLSQIKKRKQHLVIMPASKDAPLENFIEKISQLIIDSEDVIIASDYDEAFNQKFNTRAELHKATLHWEKENKIVLYVLNLHETVLSKIAFENADILYVVGNADAPPTINNFVLNKIKRKEFTYKARPELILLHTIEKTYPKRTIKWLRLADFGMHHHVRLYREDDLQRMLRFFCGKAVGVVLGGGGVRSWAHIGAIKALTELNIPIDVIGGTSAGAIVGGYYALYEKWEDSRHDLHTLSLATNKTLSIWNLTWPAVSIFDGKSYTLKQKKVYGRARIENLWRSFFCVSCNLAKSSAVLQKTGLLWRRIRTSTSVPGVFPPVVIRGAIYLDGGIVNNLPVDLMQKLSGNIGTIIAVELIHHETNPKSYFFPPILPFWKVVLSKLGIAFRDYHFPHFVDTFLKSLLVGSAIKQKENGRVADILIQPDLSKFHLLSITSKQENELIEIGYQETMKAIKKAKWVGR